MNEEVTVKEKRKYTRNVSQKTRYEELLFMHGIWTDTDYTPADFAFRIRALNLARIECQLHHLEEAENNSDH